MIAKQYFLITILTLCILVFNNLPAYSVDFYRVNLDSLNKFDVVEKGELIDLVLLNDVNSKKSVPSTSARFKLLDEDSSDLAVSGFVIMLSGSKRFSRFGSLELATDNISLADGRTVHFSATSPLLQALHPPHPTNGSFELARFITALSLAASPVTFGASLGAGFLINGFLSARQNGISDFFWGGFDGIGLSFLENIFRKQPELFLRSGTLIPFIVNDNIKVSKGLQKEKSDYLKLTEDETLSKIQELLKRGDIAGAIELSVKTRHEEICNQLMKKISS